MKAILLGATGNVGGCIARQLVEDPRCEKLVLVTRRKSEALVHPKVTELVVNMDRMEEQLVTNVQGVDVALAAFGVGKGTAKLAEEELRKIEVAYPLAFCKAAKALGARVAGVMTAVGADPSASSRYLRVIGEKEKAVASVGFDFLGLYRPAVILGNSNTPGALETVMPLVHWALPSKYHSIHKNEIARAMVRQTEQALRSLAPGGAPVVKTLEYADMKRLF